MKICIHIHGHDHPCRHPDALSEKGGRGKREKQHMQRQKFGIKKTTTLSKLVV